LAAASRTTGYTLGEWRRRARIQRRRLKELAQAARTRDGRRQRLPELIVLAAAFAFAAGVVLAWRRHR
jgi:hypothetical protein